MLGRFLFYSKTRFWPSYCQISTDLDKILHTSIVICNTFVGRLRRRSARGRLQATPERLCSFVILATHPKSYIEMTDPRDFSGRPAKWRSGRVLSWKKIRNFVAWAEPDPKTAFFRVFRIPFYCPAHSLYRKQFYPKPMVPMESRDSVRCAFC